MKKNKTFEEGDLVFCHKDGRTYKGEINWDTNGDIIARIKVNQQFQPYKYAILDISVNQVFLDVIETMKRIKAEN